MSVTTYPLTAEALFVMSSTVGRLKLLDGELIRMSPAGFEHGSMTLQLAWPIAQYVQEHQRGIVCAAETGFLLKRNPGTVRAPDRAFVSPTRVFPPRCRGRLWVAGKANVKVCGEFFLNS